MKNRGLSEKRAAYVGLPFDLSGGPTGIDLVHPWTRPFGLALLAQVQIRYPANLCGFAAPARKITITVASLACGFGWPPGQLPFVALRGYSLQPHAFAFSGIHAA